MQEHSHYSPHSDSESQPDADLMCIFICWYSPEWDAIKFTVGVFMLIWLAGECREPCPRGDGGPLY
ncbi:hypothetical protein PDJAM_G00019210 [Pangasius djambal]|uniref:Uncharacterized protein n=1 Tax=Pangasius djambal TaxID=1691987 RepID=A0ACC5YNW4_9TELE|nr:hypothetical protein [Pangasius djambal]